MKTAPPISRALAIAAAAAAAAAVLWSAHSMAGAHGTLARLDARAKQMRTLERYAAEARELDARLRAVEAAAAGPAESLQDIVREGAPEFRGEIRVHDAAPLVPGWSVRQADVAFDDFPLEQLAEVLRRAEAARPAWRLTACSIRGSAQAAGRGQVTLVFEAIEKAGAPEAAGEARS